MPQESPWKFRIWLAMVIVLLVGVSNLLTASAVRHVLLGGSRLPESWAQVVMGVARFPAMTRDALGELRYRFGGAPSPLLLDRRATEKPSWVRHFPEPSDSGYLLLSTADSAARSSVVKLLRVSDGTVLAEWKPDWTSIYAQLTSKAFEPKGGLATLRAIHPLLLDDGDIVFNTGFGMVRLGPCSPTPRWVLDELLHHSNELDRAGTIWTASVSSEAFESNPWLRDRVRDDAVARVSSDGKILERHSLTEILRGNDMLALLMGTSGLRLQPDPAHINQVSVAPSTTRHWQEGDVLISARHMSTVFLYRPSTGRILWHRMGPWMNQHDAEFVDDHRISVFDNNVIANAPEWQPFFRQGDHNRVFVYDFDTGELSQPYEALLAQARPVTVTEGRARVLPDGGLFLEETNLGRHLRFTRDRLLWSRINDFDAQHLAVLSWSRYLTAEEARVPLEALATRECQAGAAAPR